MSDLQEKKPIQVVGNVVEWRGKARARKMSKMKKIPSSRIHKAALC